MKLRFGIEENAIPRMRAVLDVASKEPPTGRKLSYLYLDTPDDALAGHGVSLRYRRTAPLGIAPPGRQWKRQEIWPKDKADGARSLKALGIRGLKARLDATFTVRIERWTWTLQDPEVSVAIDRTTVSTGPASERYAELRIVCRAKQADAAMRFAVELGAARLSSRRARERGQALLAGPG